MAKTAPAPAMSGGEQLEHNGVLLFVQKLTLGGRIRVKQSAQRLLFGDRRLPADMINAARAGDAKAVQESIQQADISMADITVVGERNAAVLISECIVDQSGKRVFPTPEDVLEVEGDEADRYIEAINALNPSIDPTAESVKAEAGNSEAITSGSSGS